MPSDESKGSQLDAIGSLAQRQLDNTVLNAAVGGIRRQISRAPGYLALPSHLVCVSKTRLSVVSKNTNELKTSAPGRFDRHRPVASPRSGASPEAMSAIRVPRPVPKLGPF